MRAIRLLGGLCLLPLLAHADAADEALIRRGREVYISEGCINCHSQYVRPGTPDVGRWGPASSLESALAAAPPLLGNRRLGPDLANVGNRRSPEWNRLHLQNPRSLSPGSRMPAYAHLFRGVQPPGEALVTYLASLGAETASARQALAESWRPVAPETGPAAEYFQRLCAECHGDDGRGHGPLAARLSLPPADFTQPGWRHARENDPDLALKLARIVKFGVPGTPMAGHEYLDDATVVALVKEVRLLHAARTGSIP